MVTLQVSPRIFTPWKIEENLPVNTSPIIVALVAIHSDSSNLGNIVCDVGMQRVEGTTKIILNK